VQDVSSTPNNKKKNKDDKITLSGPKTDESRVWRVVGVSPETRRRIFATPGIPWLHETPNEPSTNDDDNQPPHKRRPHARGGE